MEKKGELGYGKTMEKPGVTVPVTQPPKEGVWWVTDPRPTPRTMSHYAQRRTEQPASRGLVPGTPEFSSQTLTVGTGYRLSLYPHPSAPASPGQASAPPSVRPRGVGVGLGKQEARMFRLMATRGQGRGHSLARMGAMRWPAAQTSSRCLGCLPDNPRPPGSLSQLRPHSCSGAGVTVNTGPLCTPSHPSLGR